MNITTNVGYRMSLDPKIRRVEDKPPTTAVAQRCTGIYSEAEGRNRTSSGAEKGTRE